MFARSMSALAVFLFVVSSAHAYVVDFGSQDPNDFGGTWDNPNQTIDQVLSGMEDELGNGMTLTLVDQSVWTGVGATSVILEELAGYRNNTTFGWYEAADPTQSNLIFNGPDDKNTAPVVIDFGSLMDVGFYIDPNGISGNRMYSDALLNSHQDRQLLVFEIGNVSVTNSYLLAWEDLDLNGGSGGDRDYQDMLVRVTIAQVPEPMTVALLGIGLFGLYASRKMIRKA